MHHTRESFTLFVCVVFYLDFFFVFFCVCVLSPSRSNRKKKKKKEEFFFPIHDFVLLLQLDNLQSAFLQREVPEALGFQYGAKRHALAGTHSRHSALGQFNQETGRETAFVFLSSTFETFFFPLSLRCSVGARAPTPLLDVPLHVKGQMVGPGETSGDRGEERKGGRANQ